MDCRLVFCSDVFASQSAARIAFLLSDFLLGGLPCMAAMLLYKALVALRLGFGECLATNTSPPPALVPPCAKPLPRSSGLSERKKYSCPCHYGQLCFASLFRPSNPSVSASKF